MNLRRLAGYGPALIVSVTLLVLWELAVRVGGVSRTVLPAPLAIIQAGIDHWDILAGHTLQTFWETLLGLLIATVLGLIFAIALDISPWIRRAVYPLLITSQTIPMIALAPILVIWFGVELMPKLIVVTLYCVFPIAISYTDGLFNTDPDLTRLLRSMGASRWQILWTVRLPGAMPSFFSGLRIAATYSVTGAIFGEYVAASEGLGVYMKLAASAYAIDLVFAIIVVIAVLSLLLFALVVLIERIALPWYHGTRSGNQQ